MKLSPRAWLTVVLVGFVLLGAAFLGGLQVGRSLGLGPFERVLDAARDIRHRAAEPVSDRALAEAAVRGMLDALDDPYAAFLTPAQAERVRRLVRGSVVGIGAYLASAPDGLLVTSVLPGAPAARAGLAAGDVIVEVDGFALRGVESQEASQRLQGPEGSTVTLTVRRGGEDRTIEVKRARIPLSGVRTDIVGEDVGYVRLLEFGGGAADDVKAAVLGLLDRGARSIVLDLRDNGGGLGEEALATAGLFIEDGAVAQVQESGGPQRAVEAEGAALPDVPMVVLVNEGTASAAELVAGALQDRGRARLVGTRTFGKGSILSITDLGGGGGPAIQFTTAVFLTPSGHVVEGIGLRPDIEVEAGGPHDAQLDRAVQLLAGR